MSMPRSGGLKVSMPRSGGLKEICRQYVGNVGFRNLGHSEILLRGETLYDDCVSGVTGSSH